MPDSTLPHTAETIRSIVLETFKKCRQAPDDPFDASRFLAFLTLENTFKALEEGDGHKRFYQFYHGIEDELQIFIGLQKIRKNWDLEDFCDYLQRAVKGRKSGVRGAEYYNERTMGCVFGLSFIILPFIGLAIRRGEHGYWMGAVMGIIYLLVSGWFLKDYCRYRKIIKSNRP
jgi:hypothetical protein